tara:strand:- start:23965 stop:24693 length:729 start_codon:yes stop_codon:yes gene_type:complete
MDPKVLKDEMRIFKADRSAILTEIRTHSETLKKLNNEIDEEESKLLDVKEQHAKFVTQIHEMESDKKELSKQLSQLKQDLNTYEAKVEVAQIKYIQEERKHLGRIKELKDEEDSVLQKIDDLKGTYDKNSNVINTSISEKKSQERELNKAVTDLRKEHEQKLKDIAKFKEEEQKATKERLKKEDKIRARERAVQRNEKTLSKREEDVSAYVSDVTVVYFRLKELYAEIDPSVDFEKLINKTV